MLHVSPRTESTDERFCKVDALGCAILGRHVAVLESPMNLDLGPAFTRAQWIAPPKRAEALDARDKVLTAVTNQLKSHGINLPLPTLQILFHDQTDDRDGDRARQREGWATANTDVPVSRQVPDAIRHLSGSKPREAEGE